MNTRVVFLVALVTASLAVNSALFWVFEHGVNPSVQDLFDVVWWWVVTSATVGYGDIVPATWQGRVIGIVTILAGFLIYTSFVAIIVESVHEYLERRHRGTAQIKSSGHVVICEYTAVADELVQSVGSIPELNGRDVVIVSDLISRSPYPQHSFVYGVPINPAVLRRANVEEADYVFVFANLRFGDPDIKTLHVATRVRKLNPDATVVLELTGGDESRRLASLISGKVVVLDSKHIMQAVLRGEVFSPGLWMGKDAHRT